MANINIHHGSALTVTVNELCPYDKPARFATLAIHNDRDDVTLFFGSLAEVEAFRQRIQAALAERTVAPVTP